jgi:prolyl-tRNA synthetase
VQGEYFRAIVGSKWKVLMDLRDARLGEKIGDWEQSGYPIRIECWERDIENGKCVIASRISWEKIVADKTEVINIISRLHEEWQAILLERSRARLQENTIACTTLEEIGEALEWGNFALYEWDGNPEFEKVIKEKWKATTRCIPFAGQFTDKLLNLKDSKNMKVVIARSF